MPNRKDRFISPDFSFHYRKGRLAADGVDLDALVEKHGSPLYVYSAHAIRESYSRIASAFKGSNVRIHYAVKANSNQAVIATLAGLGAGMDVVSEGELRRARAAGVPGDKIIFAGVGKTRAEMAYALAEGILGFNVESEPELEALSEVAASLGRTASIAFRVNPDVDAKTHAKISLVVRRESGRLGTFVHFGTGNYHPITARIYTDLSYFSCDPALGRDAAKVFNYMTGYATPDAMEKLSIAPLTLRTTLRRLIDDETLHDDPSR